MVHGQSSVSVSHAKKFALYFVSDGERLIFEVRVDMQTYLLERLFCKQYRERKDTRGR